MNIKYLKLIPLANVLMVLLTMVHVYYIDMNINHLLLFILGYNVVTGFIVYKYRTIYKIIELEWSKLLLIILTLIGIITMILMILVFENLDVMGILFGLAIAMIINLTQIIICLK